MSDMLVSNNGYRKQIEDLSKGTLSPTNESEKVKNEFAIIFYKEVLKESFGDDFFGMEGNAYSGIAKDVFIENMAKELAEKNSKMLDNSIIKR